MNIITPDILKTLENEKFEHVYLATQVVGHGCGGPDGEEGNYNIAFKKQFSLAEFEVMVEVINKEVKTILKNHIEETLALAGSAPVWDEEWTGSYEEWKLKNKEWKTRASSRPEERPIRKDLWTSLYGATLLPSFHNTILNQEDLLAEASLTANDLFVIGVYDDRGCRCSGGRYYFHDSEESKEEPLAFPFLIDASITPRATIIYVDEHWTLIASGHLDAFQIQGKLHSLAEIWEQKIQADIAELFNLESQYIKLISAEELEHLDYINYQIHKDDPSQGYKIQRFIQALKEPGHSLNNSLKKMKFSTLMVK